MSATAQSKYLFVYGTLMRGECRHHFLAAGGITSIALATIAGELFDLGDYPAMQLSSSGNSRVSGEVIEMATLDDIIARVDDEEGPEYRRELVSVRLSDNTSLTAWTYVFTSAIDGWPRIASGDWRSR